MISAHRLTALGFVGQLVGPAVLLLGLFFVVACEPAAKSGSTAADPIVIGAAAEAAPDIVDSQAPAPQAGLQPVTAEMGKLTPYPLATCLVSGERLDSMGEPAVFAYQGREIKLCCESCVDSFNSEPAKYLARLDKPTAGAHDGHDHTH